MPIKIEHLGYVYNPKTAFATSALTDINLTVNDGDFLGVIGHTGSGKSTLITHLNALTRIQTGAIFVDEIDLRPKKIDFKKLRSRVGMVFQYPEYQLFDETVYKDVSFGPKNIGLSQDEIAVRVKEAIELVGLDYEAVKDRSPFELSGGQMRRVALAGVIAMRPEVLVLDEPTAGLDPKQRISIRNYISKIAFNKIVIIATHVVPDIEFIARDIIMLKKGVIVDNAPPHELTRKIEGKVWNVPCLESEVQSMQDKFRVTNIARDDESGDVLLKVLSEDMPTITSKNVTPTLEDYYLYVFGDSVSTT